MKKLYEAPTFELNVVAVADVITLSLGKLDIESDSFGEELGEITIG